MRVRRWRTGALAVAGALLCAGCGGLADKAEDAADGRDTADDKPSSASASPSGSPEAEPGAEEPGAKGDAGKLLAELDVRRPGSMDGYARDRFPHWSAQGDDCDTREAVLKRDGERVRTDDDCRAVSGSWRSPYDGKTWREPGDVDIDHLVPLAEAWRSGASEWDDDRREGFANDLDRPQLLAVTDNVNQSKGDQPPDSWRPSLKSYWCTYAEDWVTVKHHYDLSVTTSEKKTLGGMLDRC